MGLGTFAVGFVKGKASTSDVGSEFRWVDVLAPGAKAFRFSFSVSVESSLKDREIPCFDTWLW